MEKNKFYRLIIIGNGFDLAHGFETRFKDFLEDYLVGVLNNFFKNGEYVDELIRLSIKSPYKKSSVTFPDNIEPHQLSKFWNEILPSSPMMKLEYLQSISILKHSIGHNTIHDWVDFEQIFFELLKGAAKRSHAVESLNSQLSIIRKKLVEYLKKKTDDKYNGIDTMFTASQMIAPLVFDDLVSGVIPGEKPEEIMLLNFNYTYTAERYANKCSSLLGVDNHVVYLNPIHGDLDGNDGEPIFGYGDDLDIDYKDFENKMNDELYKHIKAFNYKQNSNYFNLLRFISERNFQVFLYGHSCGLSDRTLLNTIFEHDNCFSIKLFFHEKRNDEGEVIKDDYMDKMYMISRHFGDKTKFRARVVSKDKSSPMHQFDK